MSAKPQQSKCVLKALCSCSWPWFSADAEGAVSSLKQRQQRWSPSSPTSPSVRLTAATCCRAEGLKFIWYWFSFSSFTYAASLPRKAHLWALILKQRIWFMGSVGGMRYWHEWLFLFLGSPGLLTAWLNVVPGESTSAPWEPPAHSMPTLAGLSSHLNSSNWGLGDRSRGDLRSPVWSTPLLSAWGAQTPSVNIHLWLTYDLLSGMYDLTILSSMALGFGVRQAWVHIPILAPISITASGKWDKLTESQLFPL